MREQGRPVVLFGKIYRWDTDYRLEMCSVVSHCFVSNRHTGVSGCVRPSPRLRLVR